MANVLFKRGTQAELNALITASKIKDGAFYLTTDTNRLYVGNGSTLAELNRYVKVVKAEADLNNLQANLNDFVHFNTDCTRAIVDFKKKDYTLSEVDFIVGEIESKQILTL